jgi:hypothetical protein
MCSPVVSYPTNVVAKTFPHLQDKTSWKMAMEPAAHDFLRALKSCSVCYVTCELCKNNHTFEHLTAVKHFKHVWEVLDKYPANKMAVEPAANLPYEQARGGFWQTFSLRSGGLRFNHLDGSIEVFGGQNLQPPPEPSPPPPVPLPKVIVILPPDGTLPQPPPPKEPPPPPKEAPGQVAVPLSRIDRLRRSSRRQEPSQAEPPKEPREHRCPGAEPTAAAEGAGPTPRGEPLTAVAVGPSSCVWQRDLSCMADSGVPEFVLDGCALRELEVVAAGELARGARVRLQLIVTEASTALGGHALREEGPWTALDEESYLRKDAFWV